MTALYDTIGRTYADYRRPDTRIAAAIDGALGDASSVVDVGSGTGSYEPRGRRVVALEPSITMIRQRGPDAAPVVRGVAERLPFADDSFDVALVVLSLHHWPDPPAGLAELARVAPRQVVLTWDPEVFARFWLIAEYVPQIAAWETGLATIAAVEAALEVVEVRPVPVPWDCTDGFCGAYWRRPHRYLDPGARAAISGFWHCEPHDVEGAMLRLGRDLADGAWHDRHREQNDLTELDLGYRLVIASGTG
jgi:SAM-dependent methyltransferase